MHLLLYIQYVQHWHNIACMLASALAEELVTVFQSHNALILVLLKPGRKTKQNKKQPQTPTVVAFQAVVQLGNNSLQMKQM